MSIFVDALKKEADQALPNVSVTENGAIGKATTGKALLDINFALSSMRNMSDNEIWNKFLLAYNEDPFIAILWLFFARDVREGCGERRVFRVIFKQLCYENDTVAMKLLPLVPFYGRWDDLTDVFFGEVPCKIREEVLDIIRDQLEQDLDNARMKRSVSLLAKWLPSANTSSRETRRRAEELRTALGWTPKQYRKTLSRLRSYIGVVEQNMSANEWSEIHYESVPSRAAMNYRDAFARHDGDRYNEYLTYVKEGKAKINAGVLFPYDIVHAYFNGGRINVVDATLEEQWKALPNKVPENGSTLVVVDGSGSMCARVGNTNVSCHDVARSLGIYFSEKLSEPFADTFITFSAHPKFVRFNAGLTLNGKLKLLEEFDECANTNVEAVFDLILETAVKNHLRQDEIPANVLILSDMEFDMATYRGGYGWCGASEARGPVDKDLFDSIAERWEEAGYQLPRLIFWNICSRTGTIPVTENELGVALVSGFSPNIADMVMSSELDPYKCLLKKLFNGRYVEVENALKE